MVRSQRILKFAGSYGNTSARKNVPVSPLHLTPLLHPGANPAVQQLKPTLNILSKGAVAKARRRADTFAARAFEESLGR